MNVRFNGTIFCFYLAYYLYAKMDFGVHDTQSVGLGVWGRCVLYVGLHQNAYFDAR